MTTTKTVPGPRIVAWEITRSCNLYCAHCRASATSEKYAGELSTQECFSIINQLKDMGRPMLILTGGEPLERKDFFEIAEYASRKGFRVTTGCNGTLLTPEIAVRMAKVPIARVAISLDFPTAELQDKFRGMAGAFEKAMQGMRNATAAGVPLQINATVTKMNAPYMEDLVRIALDVGAVAFHPFLLVPTGRGKGLEKEELPPEEYERILRWICEKQVQLDGRLLFKPTDAPHFTRVRMQYAKECGLPSPTAHGHGAGGHPGGRPSLIAMLGRLVRGQPGGHPGGMSTMTRGCLAGTGFCFISHVGRVQGCGYLDVEAGDLKRQSFREVWEGSKVFCDLRDTSLLKGKCGRCEFKKMCGGCRARAYETTGDYLNEEPYCIYQPKMRQENQTLVGVAK
ncbi:MAG: radical SAM protein [Dehalococcoidia bacterium]|nr:radical SAM protein [Dehalococcoidia bacterium]